MHTPRSREICMHKLVSRRVGCAHDFVSWLNVADTLPDPSAYAGTNFQSITDGDVEIVA